MLVFLLLLSCFEEGVAQNSFTRGGLRARRAAGKISSAKEKGEQYQIAGLDVAVWQPSSYPAQGAPLVVFSHGFHGVNTQSISLMKALASEGYLVVSPNHKDAMGSGRAFYKPEENLGNPASWNDQTHVDRHKDVVNLLKELKSNPKWRGKIDWSKLVLAGHSLGGYTAMGCAGAWKTWTVPDVKAVLAISPYCQPFAKHKTLAQLHPPLMYLSGTRDIGILPFIKRPGGAFDQAGSPTYLVVFDKASHFAFTNFNRNSEQNNLINHYCTAFLNKFVLGDAEAKPDVKLDGVTELDVK